LNRCSCVGSCGCTTSTRRLAFSWSSAVLSHEAVARLELVEPHSELLVRSSHSRVQLLLTARPVFAVARSGELCLDSLTGDCPLGLGALAFDVGEGAGRCALPYTAVHVSVPFHAAGVRIIVLLSPLVGFLVFFDPAVAGAPSYFGLDLWLLAAEFGDEFPYRNSVSLSWTRVVRGHPPYGRLSVRKYGRVCSVRGLPSQGCGLWLRIPHRTLSVRDLCGP